ncbi:MAG: methionine--tRNA ligase [Candidatus Eisenbacteria bacterium]|nr:methionine--tRNA ligase [Candidatus Eisenbacteria bacterium]
MGSKYYITTAIDYVNSAPHIGTAYEKISADVFARFHRMIGDDVYFQMGNDEHSLNVLRAARKKGLDPKDYCDRMEKIFRDIWRGLEIEYDHFIRTTDEQHVAGLRKLFASMEDDIYRGHYEGYYCESCEAFLQEKDLVDGNCPVHETRPSWITEENYFFRLSKYAGALLEHIEEHPEFIEPESRRNEIIQLLRGGLSDISITRAGVDWGVPLPMDESQMIYVWADALSNYATGAGYGTDEERFSRWWPADVHVIGKDITRFHCVIWPAMLLSAGVELPRKVFGHGFVYFKGQRLSKSRGVVVDPLEAADVFGPCALRYFLMREGTYGRDVDFTWEQFRARYDSELANDLGNLVSRATAMVVKFLGGDFDRPEPLSDGELAHLAQRVRSEYEEAMRSYAPQSALSAVWELVRRANAYIEEEKPWALAKSDPDRLPSVLFEVLESIRQTAVLSWPVMPGKCGEILEGLGLGFQPGERDLDAVLAWGAEWPERVSLRRAEAVFPKYTEEELVKAFDAHETKGETGMLSFEEFQKLELKLGKVLEAERVEGTDKLLRIEVDLGDGDVRQMVAGIAGAYSSDELTGRTVVVVANLEPATIRGVESRAMLLAASDDQGPALLVPDREVAPGTRVR